MTEIFANRIRATVAIAATAAFALGLAAAATAQDRDGSWEVHCGDPLAETADRQSPDRNVNDTDMGGHGGHRTMRALFSDRPDDVTAFEIWALSDGIGWWLMLSQPPHPDDRTPPDAPTPFDEIQWTFEGKWNWLAQSSLVSRQVVIANALPPASRLRCASGEAAGTEVGNE